MAVNLNHKYALLEDGSVEPLFYEDGGQEGGTGKMQNGIDSDKLLDALDRVTWYNGLAEQVLEWKKIPVEPDITGEPQIKHLYSSLDGEQLEVIWMIAVSLFGDYGTSPRSGWITDIEGFYAFIDRITKTYRE